MKIDTLEAYNIAPEILRVWRETVGTELLPVQERAVKEFGLFSDENLIAELLDQEETHARDALREVLGSSVAFHNSDLSPEERDLVERHFREGGIRALFSTSTLAMGMNLPTRNVILDTDKWKCFRHYGGRWDKANISKSDYENMSGRAGRLAFAQDFGRSILVTHSPFHAANWLRTYAGGDFENVVPTLTGAPLENHVVDVVAAELAESREALRTLLLSSFTGFVEWAAEPNRADFSAALDRAVRLCLEGNVLAEDAEGRLTATALGRACATKGLGVKTSIAMARWAQEARSTRLTDLEVLTAVSLTPAGDAVYVAMSSNERDRADYRAQLLQRARALRASERPVFERFADDRWAIEYDTAKALKKALFLGDWIEEARVKDIEGRFHVWAGSIRRIGAEYGWLVEGLSAVAKACGWPDDRCVELRILSERLSYGVFADALPLARLRVRGVGRAHLRALVEAGLVNAAALHQAGPAVVRDAIGHRAAFEALWATVAPHDAPSPADDVMVRAAASTPPVADVRAEGDPQVWAHVARDGLAELAVAAGGGQVVDEVGARGEERVEAVLQRAVGDGDGKVGLAAAGLALEDDGAALGDEVAREE